MEQAEAPWMRYAFHQGYALEIAGKDAILNIVVSFNKVIHPSPGV
ncbi:hypothetical protein B14911_02100 [Bacillus sp. NRRL B-14911]|nr:hypothetical protein B14911_02100 [Bacillus sp. NRRL B-14911]